MTRRHVADRGLTRHVWWTDAKLRIDLPPHTEAASTADSALTRCALPPRIAKYVCSTLAVLYAPF
ncbi:hypothetical protein DPMN_043726 [Dreissena polymorpha]|uniref:Uncharacterized protein n=1 Tax=Dreissena polymorpha TaxID=45954 RepID=A0A9D4D1M5_DREPO|nr:hypothetical protein DPMN_043726 [Dreissena polymorpha]